MSSFWTRPFWLFSYVWRCQFIALSISLSSCFFDQMYLSMNLDVSVYTWVSYLETIFQVVLVRHFVQLSSCSHAMLLTRLYPSLSSKPWLHIGAILRQITSGAVWLTLGRSIWRTLDQIGRFLSVIQKVSEVSVCFSLHLCLQEFYGVCSHQVKRNVCLWRASS